MKSFTTHIQEIAVSLAFAVMDESRINRTYQEYMTIAASFPPLKVLTFRINELLRKLHETEGTRIPQICRFKAGDRFINYEPYPKTISYETLRAALVISGMRERRGARL
jgi:hypothetical protein